MSQDLQMIEEIHTLLSPNLIQNDFAKRIIALQIFANPNIGEKLHILMVGEGASGKSTLLMEVSDVVPNSGFVSNKTTPAGLIEKAISANSGILNIDEFDKINIQVRNSLLEFMQTGIISIDQSGRHIQAEANTNVLAGCNPMKGKLQSGIPIYRQLSFSDNSLPLLSRFHLIIPFKSPDSSLYSEISVSNSIPKDVDAERKKRFMAYIRGVKIKYPVVSMTEQQMRNVGEFVRTLKETSSFREIVSPRTIEGFKTCLYSCARMNHRTHVNDEDFRYVEKIFDGVYHSSTRRF